MELKNEFIEPEKMCRMFQDRMICSYIKEGKQKDLKFLEEATKENHESSINIENYKTGIRNATNNTNNTVRFNEIYK